MIKDIQELNFPKLEGQEKSYATMSAATVSLQDMGDKTITSQIKIDGQITPDFSFDWEVVFKGEKYIMPLRQPQGVKENTTLNSLVDLTFQHWAIYQLKRRYFFTIQTVKSGTAVPDKYIAPVILNLGDFCNLFGQVLEYYYGDTITIDLNDDPETGWQYKSEPEVISISYSYLWDVLTKLYEVYAVRWQIEPNGSPDKYVIKVGYPTTEQSHIFEYGFNGGLLKLERRVQDDDIRNMYLGRGGKKNLPYRYFKDVDPQNTTFKADPDWIPELRNIPFSELRPKTFRDYVRGWKTNPNRQLTEADGTPITPYPHDNTVQPIAVEPYDEEYAAKSFAYRLGHTDEKFDPVEYVKDDGSIKRYGELEGGLDNNEDIYPSIQGVVVNPYGRIDEAVYVEEIVSDDVVEAVESDAQLTTIKGATNTAKSQEMATISVTVDFPEFSVESDKTAILETGVSTIKAHYKTLLTGSERDISDKIVLKSTPAITVKNVVTGETHSASGIPAGRWYWSATFEVEITYESELQHSKMPVWVTVGYESPTLKQTTLSDKWTNTFDILVKNIWGTSKQSNETDEQYAKRVWELILGDRAGNEAKVVFASGALSISEDYEFTIVDIPKYEHKECTWQTVEQGEIVPHKYDSEWRITLAKSDADLDTLGTYVPSTMRQGKAGDYFFFIGIDMPFEYVVWAEERVDAYKTDILNEKKDIKPTFVVTTDRVRFNNEGKPDALINKLHIGDTLKLADKRFIIKEDDNIKEDDDEQVYETLYLSSLTYTYREPSTEDAALNPDVEIVLSDSYASAANPVATLQGEVSALAKQVGSISNVEQIVRAVCDKLYLRKDGIPDRSLSPTEFASLVRSLDFRSGIVGGAGWGIYKDENGNWVIEADRFKARNDLEVNNLIINQVIGQGGTMVESAARMEITRVEETTNGYKCYFDQKNGSVANLFHVDDIAWNNRYTPENADLKFYRRRVTEVGADYVVLTKPLNGTDRPSDWPDSGVNGTGVPSEGDVIVQRGNYTDANRQFIKVRDVIGGGYERYIQNLDSVNAEGKEYYFVGRVNGDTPRLLIGTKDADYAEWYEGKLNIKGSISVESVIGDTTLGDIIENITDVDYLTKVFKDRTLIDGGLVLSTLLKMGVNNTDFTSQTTYAGMSGLYDPDKIGGGIAVWFGGDMLDKADYFDWNDDTRQWVQKQGVDITGLRIASGLDRMDGTGYRADGNIWWDNDGKVYADPMSFFVGENTLGNITQLFKFYPGQNYPFAEVTYVEPTRPFKNLKLGFNSNNCAEIYYDAEKDCVVVTKTLLSLGDLQSKKYSEIEGGGSGAIQLLTDWSEYTDADKNWLGLSAGLGYGLKSDITALNTRIDNLPTSSVNPYALTIQKNGSTVGTYDGSAAKTINISDVASAATLSGHIDNTTIHITSAERTKWNKVVSDFAAITGSDTDNVINKYEEIVAFLATYTEADTLANLLSNKTDKSTQIIAGTGLSGGGTLAADRTLSLATSGVTAGTYSKLTVDAYGRATSGSNPTTLAGYGITDAYTKTEADGRFLGINATAKAAEKLATTSIYTAWGQTFFENGVPKSISGDMTGVGSISFANNGVANIGSNTAQAQWVYAKGIYGKTGSDFWLGANNITQMAITTGGNVGIGTTSPAYKLDVNGVARVSQLKLGKFTFTDKGDYVEFDGTILALGDVQSKKHANIAGGGTGDGGDFSIMSSWDASLANDPDYVLSAGLGYNLHITKLDKTEAEGLYQPKGNYLTQHQSLANYVTLNTAQTISGTKTFASSTANCITLRRSNTSGGAFIDYYALNSTTDFWRVGMTSNKDFGFAWYGNMTNARIDSAGNIYATAFKRVGGTSSQFLKADGSVDSNSYALSSSLGNYLPLSGGKITSAIPSPLDVNSTDAAQTGIRIQRKNTNKGWFGHYDTQGTIVYNYASNKHLGIKDDGTPVFNGSTLWHQGNDGSGSGLDADLLDGLHYTAFARADQSPQVDLNTVNGIGMMGNGTNAAATAERNYPIREAGCLIYCTSANYSANQIYGTYYTNRWYARGGGEGINSKTAWREFAFTDSTVAAANKLATARNFAVADYDGSHTGEAVSFDGTAAATLKLPNAIKCNTLTATNSVTCSIARIGTTNDYGYWFFTPATASSNGALRVGTTEQIVNANSLVMSVDKDTRAVNFHKQLRLNGNYLYLNDSKRLWVDGNGVLHFNGTILVDGDVQSKKASDMSGDSMVSLYVTGSGKTLKIPVWASAVFIRSLLDGDAYTIEIDGDPSEIECLPIYVYEQSPGDGTIKWKNPDGTYLSNYQYYGSGLFMLVNMGAGKLKLVKIVSGNY